MIHHHAVCNPLSLSAAFAVGIAGSAHCVAMCGGLSGALGLGARHATTPGRASLLSACHQLGRLCGYASAGVLVGCVGGMLQGLFHSEPIEILTRMLAGSVLLCIGTAVLFHWRPLAVIERFGGRLWRHIAPLSRSIPAAGVRGALLLGMLWGFLPCGFVYSMLIFAALQGGPLQSAALMLSFGLGTVPTVLAAGLLTAAATRSGWGRRLHAAAGWSLLVFGALTILAPLPLKFR